MIIYNAVSFSKQRKTWQKEKKGLALRSPFFALKNIKRGFSKTKGYRREIREYVWSVLHSEEKSGNICLDREEDNESNNGPPNEHSHENANPCMIVYINCKLLVAYIVLLV